MTLSRQSTYDFKISVRCAKIMCAQWSEIAEKPLKIYKF